MRRTLARYSGGDVITRVDGPQIHELLLAHCGGLHQVRPQAVDVGGLGRTGRADCSGGRGARGVEHLCSFVSSNKNAETRVLRTAEVDASAINCRGMVDGAAQDVDPLNAACCLAGGDGRESRTVEGVVRLNLSRVFPRECGFTRAGGEMLHRRETKALSRMWKRRGRSVA